MAEIPNRLLTPKELEAFKKEQELKKALEGVERRFLQRAERPTRWFGRLLAVLLVAIFLDITGWIGAFISGRAYAVFAFLLQTVETVCIVGLAILAVHGSVEAYRLQQARASVTQRLRGEESPPS